MNALNPRIVAAAAALALAGSAHAQVCTHEGSRWSPGFWEDGPPLACTGPRAEPSWHLYSPPHRVVVSRNGWTRGPARAFGRLFLRYRCTGLWWAPVRLAEVRTLGYVVDVAPRRCRPRS